MEDEYDVDQEIQKFKWADIIFFSNTSKLDGHQLVI